MSDLEEREANQFAMELLMPSEWVRREIRKLGGIDLCDDKKIQKLAKMFGVPQTIMAIRLGQIGNDPTTR